MYLYNEGSLFPTFFLKLLPSEFQMGRLMAPVALRRRVEINMPMGVAGVRYITLMFCIINSRYLISARGGGTSPNVGFSLPVLLTKRMRCAVALVLESR